MQNGWQSTQWKWINWMGSELKWLSDTECSERGALPCERCISRTRYIVWLGFSLVQSLNCIILLLTRSTNFHGKMCTSSVGQRLSFFHECVLRFVEQFLQMKIENRIHFELALVVRRYLDYNRLDWSSRSLWYQMNLNIDVNFQNWI